MATRRSWLLLGMGTLLSVSILVFAQKQRKRSLRDDKVTEAPPSYDPATNTTTFTFQVTPSNDPRFRSDRLYDFHLFVPNPKKNFSKFKVRNDSFQAAGPFDGGENGASFWIGKVESGRKVVTFVNPDVKHPMAPGKPHTFSFTSPGDWRGRDGSVRWRTTGKDRKKKKPGRPVDEGPETGEPHTTGPLAGVDTDPEGPVTGVAGGETAVVSVIAATEPGAPYHVVLSTALNEDAPLGIEPASEPPALWGIHLTGTEGTLDEHGRAKTTFWIQGNSPGVGQSFFMVFVVDDDRDPATVDFFSIPCEVRIQ